MKEFKIFYPLKNPSRVVQTFGENPEYYSKNIPGLKAHNGWDIVGNHNQKVRATHDGEVVYAGVDSKEGWGVVLRTTEKFDYGAPLSFTAINEVYFKTIYWHLIKEIPVKVGQKVKAGDVIGYADNTGFSTGDHLHFGLKPQQKGENDWTWFNIENENGYFGAIDPAPYFNNYCAEDAQLVISIYSKIAEILKLIINLFFKK